MFFNDSRVHIAMRGNDLTSLPFVSFTVIRTKEYFFHPVKNKENYYESFILI